MRCGHKLAEVSHTHKPGEMDTQQLANMGTALGVCPKQRSEKQQQQQSTCVYGTAMELMVHYSYCHLQNQDAPLWGQTLITMNEIELKFVARLSMAWM